jgi:hypothetical protein
MQYYFNLFILKNLSSRFGRLFNRADGESVELGLHRLFGIVLGELVGFLFGLKGPRVVLELQLDIAQGGPGEKARKESAFFIGTSTAMLHSHARNVISGRR